MGLYDALPAKDLLAAVREFLLEEIRPLVEDQPIARMHFGVAVTLLALVERELVLAPRQEIEAAQLLASLGVSSEAELAQAIRTGQLDNRKEEVLKVLTQLTHARLMVASPRYLEQLKREREALAAAARSQRQGQG